ncbi:MAG: ubiquinone biosynthesis protein [Gammaproteobacteria bacterium]
MRVRGALEELGPTFVKVRQLLAARPDLLPPAWTEELPRLHNRATPVPYAEVHAQLLEDLGAEPASVFRRFDNRPLAAASIAQVYRAELIDGTPVVLKVRRPGIREVVEADLRLLSRLAEQAESRMPEVRRFRPRSLVRQFARSLRNELDLRIENRNAERLRANAQDSSSITIPHIHGH